MGSIVILRSRKTALGDAQAEVDELTKETLVRYTTVVLDADFTGAGAGSIPAAGSPAAGCDWAYKQQGTPVTPAPIANYPGGALRLALAATSEKEEVTLYANDVLNWDMTKSAIWEARLANHVLPTGVAEIVFGLHSVWIDGPDNAGFYADFQQSASGVVNFRTKDGVNTLTNVSPVTMVADAFHNFRIDATDPTNVRFFIDGVEVSTTGQMSFAATGASAVLQPYLSVYNASGVGVATLDVDMVQIGMNRS